MQIKALIAVIILFGSISLAQSEALIIWNNHNKSKVVYPIALSNDTLTKEFCDKHVKYLNVVPISPDNINYAILSNQNLHEIVKFAKIEFDIEQGANYSENENLSYPEMKYVVNDSVSFKLVFSSTEIFVRVLNNLRELSKTFFTPTEYQQFDYAIKGLYEYMGSSYYEIEER